MRWGHFREVAKMITGLYKPRNSDRKVFIWQTVATEVRRELI